MDKYYFFSSNYTDGYETNFRLEDYNRRAVFIIDLITKNYGFNIVSDYIIDYGCATGIFMEALRNSGVPSKNIIGLDASNWALLEATNKNLKVFNIINEPDIKKEEVMLSLDVFEHMKDADIKKSLELISPETLVVKIPVKANEEDDEFHLECSKKSTDPTHINCKTKKEWTSFLKDAGYEFKQTINEADVFYDSLGVFCAIFQKEKSKQNTTKLSPKKISDCFRGDSVYNSDETIDR